MSKEGMLSILFKRTGILHAYLSAKIRNPINPAVGYKYGAYIPNLFEIKIERSDTILRNSIFEILRFCGSLLPYPEP